MSFQSLESWDPMEEDYNCREFNSYSSVNRAIANQCRPDNRMPEEKDLCSLYIKYFPLDANHNVFLESLKKYGHVVRHSFRAYEENVVVLIRFSSTQEAERALRGLHRMPPYNLDVQYANKQKDRSNPDSNDSYHRPHSSLSEHRPQSSFNDHRPQSSFNDHRSQSSFNDHRSQSSFNDHRLQGSFNDHRPQSSFSETKSVLQQGIGRGMYLKSFDEAELKDMRIVCENNKRDVLCTAEEEFLSEGTNQFGGARPRTISREASSNVSQSTIKSSSYLSNVTQVVPSHERSFEISNLKISSPYEPPSSHNSYVFKLPKLISIVLDCQCCNAPSHLWCSSCNIPYCSIDCQSQDWSEHEKICKSRKTSGSSDSTLSDASHSSGCQERGIVRNKNNIETTNSKPRSEPKKRIDFNGKSFSSESDPISDSPNGKKIDSESRNNKLIPLPLQIPRRLESNGIHEKKIQKAPNSAQPSNNLSVKSDKPSKIFKYQDLKTIVLPESTEKVIVIKIESLTKFWIMRRHDKETLCTLEKQISQLKDKIPLSRPNMYDLAIALNKDKKLCRSLVKEIDNKMEISRVQFLDYGGEEKVKISNLYLMSELLKDYPPLAITCKLSDVEVLKNCKEEIEHFKSMTLSNEFKAYHIKSDNDVYELSLVNDEGLSISSMLALQQQTTLLSSLEQSSGSEVPARSSEAARSLPLVTNIYTELKKSMKLKVAPAINNHNQHFIYAVTSEETFKKEFPSIMDHLENLRTEDVSSKAKEGDIVAGFSIKFNSWYRCLIMRNTKGKFLVRYLDYGNEEEIVLLKRLPPIVLKILSSVVRCESTETFFIESSAILKQTGQFLDAIVNSTSPDCAELLVQGSKHKYVVKCFPLYSDFSLPASKQEELLSSTPVKSKIKVPLISDLANCTLPSDESVDVLFWHAENNLHYCQKSSDLTRLNNLLTMLQLVPDDQLVSNSPAVNEVYCVKCSDGSWYRGSIKEVCQKGTTFKVFFIDFGNDEVVPLSSLKYLPKECVVVPKLCIPVKIQNLNSIKDILNIGNSNPVPVKAVGSVDGGVQIINVLNTTNVDDKVKMLSFQSQSLSFDSPTDISITYFENSTYYCHKRSDVTQVLAMQTKLQSCEQIPLSQIPETEEVFRVKSSDGCWYRGAVKSVLPGGKSFNIYFFDYGNTEQIASTDVLQLPKTFESYPIFCIPFKISDADIKQTDLTVIGVGSSDGVQLVKLVLPKSIVKLTSLKALSLPENVQSEIQLSIVDKSIFCHDASHQKDLSKLNVLLQNYKSRKDISHKPVVDEILCVKSKDGNWYRGCVKAVLPENMYNVFLIDYGSSENISLINMQVISEELLPFPIFSIPIIIQDREHLNLNVNHTYTAEVIKKQENSQVIQIVNSCPIGVLKNRILELNAKYQVAFFHAENEIYYLQLISDALDIQNISELMQICQKQESLVHNPYIGELVCAKSSSDNCWYRGTVQELLPLCTFKVLFIDYGNTEKLDKQSLQRMPESLLKFPVYCVPVKVTNINALADSFQLERLYDIVVDTVSETPDVRILGSQAANQEVNSNINVETEVLENVLPFKYSDCKQGVVSNGMHTIVVTNVTPLAFMLADETIFENLVTLLSSITQYVQQLQCTTYDGSHIEAGQMVLAEYNGDWYRAFVSDISQSEDQSYLYEVYYIDYGNVEKVTKKSLRSMIPKFMSLEVHTHLADLKGISYEDENKEAVLRELESYKNLPLEASVENTDSSLFLLSIPQIANILLERNLVIAT